MTEHAKLSASSSHRWINCPGSITLESTVPQTAVESCTQEGTCAHELAEICLKDWSDAHDYVGKKLTEAPEIEVDTEMADHINEYLKYCTDTLSYIEIEKRVSFDKWVAGGFGTADCVGVDEGTLHVIDLKYGKGVKVDAYKNSQLLLYGLGAYEAYHNSINITNVSLHVYQPRMDNVSYYELSVSELLEFGKYVKNKAKLCLSDNPERVVGDSQCKFCKAKAICPTLAKHVEETVGSCFDDISKDSLDVKKVDIKTVLDNKKLIESFLNAVQDYAFNEIEQGRKVDGYKIVEGRSIRSWLSTEDVYALFEKLELSKDKMYSRKIVSPAQVKKIVSKDDYKLFEEIIIKPKGKPTLAPDSDKRASLESIIDKFEEI